MSGEHNSWVIAEHLAGAVPAVAYEVVAFAREVTDSLGGQVTVVVLGKAVEDLGNKIAEETGCDVLAIRSPGAALYQAEGYRALIKGLYDPCQSRPSFIFIPHTATGWDYAPALAVDLKASCLTAVSGFRNDQGLVFSRQICNGKMIEELKPLKGRPAVITVMPGAAAPLTSDGVSKGKVSLLEFEAPPVRTQTIAQTEGPPRTTNLREAEVIVAAGRGLVKEENLDLIKELAGLFQRSAVGASRPLCDKGWLPIEHQVGMTGQTVSPKLYIACGISGAIQHTMGIKDAGLIVAINTDSNSLFCRLAHFCVKADLAEFLPLLIEKIRNFR